VLFSKLFTYLSLDVNLIKYYSSVVLHLFLNIDSCVFGTQRWW